MSTATPPRALDGATLRGVLTRAQACPAVPEHVLLHAGPPYEGDSVPAPVRNAAAQALVYEGAAPDLAAALVLLENGRYRYAAAQDHGVVTPLAQVVSAGMPVFAVGDDSHVVYAPVLEGPPPALRFGSPQAGCVPALRMAAADALGPLGELLCRQPVALAPIVAQALAAGDECHARTGAANAALAAALDGLDADCLARIAANPGYVLPILMAACAWALHRHGEIAAAGGNGVAFGVRMHDENEWRTVPAGPPTGTVLKPDAPVLGAIGDSAVIDFAGLGGQALAAAPALQDEWRTTLPADWARRRILLDPETGLVSARRMAATRLAPIVHLAMVGADEAGGIVGRGFYVPPVAGLAPITLEPPA